MHKLRRLVAHKRMKDMGLVQVNKEKSGRSYFAKHWREVIY